MEGRSIVSALFDWLSQVSHHVQCNDDALDEDVFSAFPALRFDARLPRRPWHQWQHIYMVSMYRPTSACIKRQPVGTVVPEARRCPSYPAAYCAAHIVACCLCNASLRIALLQQMTLLIRRQFRCTAAQTRGYEAESSCAPPE